MFAHRIVFLVFLQKVLKSCVPVAVEVKNVVWRDRRPQCSSGHVWSFLRQLWVFIRSFAEEAFDNVFILFYVFQRQDTWQSFRENWKPNRWPWWPFMDWTLLRIQITLPSGKRLVTKMTLRLLAVFWGLLSTSFLLQNIRCLNLLFFSRWKNFY